MLAGLAGGATLSDLVWKPRVVGPGRGACPTALVEARNAQSEAQERTQKQQQEAYGQTASVAGDVSETSPAFVSMGFH